MEPATFSLAILRPQPPERWQRLREELVAQGAPPITLAQEDGIAAFSCRTGAFMLRARVFHALDAVWGHEAAKGALREVERKRIPR